MENANFPSVSYLAIIFDLIFASDATLIQRNKVYYLRNVQKMIWR